MRIVVGLLYMNVCMSNVYSSMAECLERRGGYWDAGWRIWGVWSVSSGINGCFRPLQTHIRFGVAILSTTAEADVCVMKSNYTLSTVELCYSVFWG